MQINFRGEDDEDSRQLSMVIRVGEVTATNPAAHKVTVTHDDDDGQTSGELPVIVPNTLANRDHALPDVGEDVLCIYLPTGTEEGFVIGSFYAGNVQNPESSQDVRATTYKDDTRFAYDRSKHEWTIDNEDTHVKLNRDQISMDVTDTHIVADKTSVSVNTPQTINLTAQSIVITMGGTTMTLNGSSAVIDTDNITFTGNMDVTGTLHTSGDISTAGGVNASGAVHGSNI